MAQIDELLLVGEHKGQPSGVAELDGSSLVPIAQLPVGTGASQVAAGNHTHATLAPLASPTFTGTPAAPTAAQGTNTTQVATTAFVRGEVAALVDSAPGALDTLNELAASLGDSADFAGAMTTALAGKQPLHANLTALAGATSPAIILTATVALTDTQIKELPTTGITVIPAVGAGFVAVPIDPPSIKVDCTAGVYTGIDAAAELRLEYASGGGQFMAPLLESAGKVTDLFGDADANFGMWVTPTEDFVDELANYENDSIHVVIDNGGGAGTLGGGNAANSAVVTIDYRLRAV